MNMDPVDMCGYDEGMPAFGKCQGQLIADTVCFLGSDLSRFEGLPGPDRQSHPPSDPAR